MSRWSRRRGKSTRSRRRDITLSTIALWQFISFFVMLLLIWVNETLDLADVFFDSNSDGIDFFGASILTAFVLVVAIITVGHTYIQEKRMLSGLITICAQCHRVRIDVDAWDKLEDYLTDRSQAVFSHGLCPICYGEEMKKLKELPLPPAKTASPNTTGHVLDRGDGWEVFTPPRSITPPEDHRRSRPEDTG